MCTEKIRLPENQHSQPASQIRRWTHPYNDNGNTLSRNITWFACVFVCTRACVYMYSFIESFNMTDENSMPPSITSSTGFGECNTSGVSSSTEQFIICCKVCGTLNNLRRCSRCKSVYYCSQVHQQVDWRVHKIECKKFATNLTTSE